MGKKVKVIQTALALAHLATFPQVRAGLPMVSLLLLPPPGPVPAEGEAEGKEERKANTREDDYWIVQPRKATAPKAGPGDKNREAMAAAIRRKVIEAEKRQAEAAKRKGRAPGSSGEGGGGLPLSSLLGPERPGESAPSRGPGTKRDRSPERVSMTYSDRFLAKKLRAVPEDWIELGNGFYTTVEVLNHIVDRHGPDRPPEGTGESPAGKWDARYPNANAIRDLLALAVSSPHHDVELVETTKGLSAGEPIYNFYHFLYRIDDLGVAYTELGDEHPARYLKVVAEPVFGTPYFQVTTAYPVYRNSVTFTPR